MVALLEKLKQFDKRMILLGILVVLAVIGFVTYNTKTFTKETVYEAADLPEEYVGFRVAHIHNLANNPGSIKSAVKKTKPDIIVVTGDLSNRGKYNNSVKALDSLTSVAPVFYVLGQSDNSEIANLTSKARYVGSDWGMINSSEESQDTIGVIGVDWYENEADTDKSLMDSFSKGSGTFNIGISSSPNHFNTIKDYGLNILLSGRNSEGEYTDKVYDSMGTTMLLSNGLHGKKPSNVNLIILSDGTIKDKTLLEKFLGLFIKDVGTIFDNDEGVSEHKYEYEDDSYRHY